MSPAGFKEWCSRRGKKSGVVRKAVSDDRRARVLELKAQGMKYKDIAQKLGLSLDTIKFYFRKKV